RWCISLKAGSTGNTLANNILIGSRRGGIEYDSTSSITSDCNLLQSGGGYGLVTNETTDAQYTLAQWQAATGNDMHSLDVPPLFASAFAAPFDFHLLAGSPGIDAGADWPSVSVDLDGVARPQNLKWDIGCYEKLSALSSGLPAAPTNLAATAISQSQIKLTWA